MQVSDLRACVLIPVPLRWPGYLALTALALLLAACSGQQGDSDTAAAEAGETHGEETALEHARKAIDLGLVPLTGKVRVDNFLMMTPDRDKLLTVCFCCHCCCMMGFYKHIPPSQLDQVI